jgi:hypothetical protein
MPISRTPKSALLPIAVALVASAALPAREAAAQGAACPTIENDAERLACYDRALRPNPPARAAQPSSSAPERAATPASASATSSAPVATSPPASAVTTSDRATRGRREPREAREARASAAPSPLAAPTPPAAPAAPSAPQASTKSSGRHDARQSQDEAIETIVIAEVRAFPGRPAVFITDGGDVWTQIDTQHANLPSTPFSATLKPGAMGSVFMVPDSQKRAIRVHQAK